MKYKPVSAANSRSLVNSDLYFESGSQMEHFQILQVHLNKLECRGKVHLFQ